MLIGTGLTFAIPAVARRRREDLDPQPGPHGFSEVLYAFTSAANNNGSAFAGLTANTPWLNAALGAVMLLGRFLPIVFVLALAGSLRRAGSAARDGGHACRPTAAVRRPHARHRRVVSALTYFPVLALGPLAEGLVHDHDPPRPTRARGRKRPDLSRAAAAFAPLCGLPDAVRKLDPRELWHNPVMLLVEVGAALTTVLAVAEPFLGGSLGRRRARRLHLVDRGLAVADRAVRDPRRVGRRGPRQGAGRIPPRDPHHTIAHRVVGYDAAADPSAERTAIEEVPSADLRSATWS